jgi:hypothetical protein
MRLPLAASMMVGLTFIACQPPEAPPIVPPMPNDPTVSRTVALQPADVIDASIVSEGGTVVDATIFVDAGASGR